MRKRGVSLGWLWLMRGQQTLSRQVTLHEDVHVCLHTPHVFKIALQVQSPWLTTTNMGKDLCQNIVHNLKKNSAVLLDNSLLHSKLVLTVYPYI